MPRRNQPESLLDQDFRLLLYGLHEPNSICDNQLLARWIQDGCFIGLTGVDDRAAIVRFRTIVDDAIRSIYVDNNARVSSTHARHQYAISTRCDLHGESHKSVAKSLGISIRQFYRERQAARKLIQQAVLAQLDRARHRLWIGPDAFTQSLARARILYEMGALTSSVEQLRALASSVTSERRRVIANAMIIEVLARSGDPALAEAEMMTARRESPIGFEHIFSVVEILVASRAGRPGYSPRSPALLDHSLQTLERSESPDDREFVSRHLILATDYFLNHDADHVRRLLNRASVVLNSIDEAAPDILAAFQTRFANLQMSQSDEPSASAAINSALRMSKAHGFVEYHSMNLCALSDFELRRGCVIEAKTLVREAVQLLPAVNSPGVKSAIHLWAATFEARTGQPHAAIARARAARQASPKWLVGLAASASVEAEACLKLGRPDQAISLAVSAYELAAKDQPRLAGLALDLMARGYLELKKFGEAFECSREAVDQLEQCEFKSSLIRARRTAATIGAAFQGA